MKLILRFRPPPSSGISPEFWLNEKLISGIPKNKRQKAKSLIDFINDHSILGANEKGELIINGKTIKNSHIVDVVQDFVRDRNKQGAVLPPAGVQQFAAALRAHNIPKEYIGNNIRKRLLFHSDEDKLTSISNKSSVGDFFPREIAKKILIRQLFNIQHQKGTAKVFRTKKLLNQGRGRSNPINLLLKANLSTKIITNPLNMQFTTDKL